MKLSEQIEKLYKQQLADWPMAGNNYAALDDVIIRTLMFSDHVIRLQYNPKRIISSSARVDPKSVSERPCFLCPVNRPREQHSIPYRDEYLLLVNPYPIFRRHLTVPTVNHQPQLIKGNFKTMLFLSMDLPEYTIIYNGPNCGASAPDHFHFQAIHRNMLPIESEYKGNQSGRLTIFDDTEIQSVKLDQRRLLAITGSDQDSLIRVFGVIYHLLEESLPAADEPMLNILTWYDSGKWIILIFPRKQHRPSQYFEAGDRQILLSPASIDLGGVLILPRNPDFEKISKDDATDILNQVCVDDFFMTVLTDRLKEVL